MGFTKPVTVSECRTCGRMFEQSGKGRPRLDCVRCRPPGSKPSQKSTGTSQKSVVARPTAARSLHKFEPNPLNDRLCRDCLGWVWEH